MIRRGSATGEVPEALLRYRPAQWPSGAAWHAARAEWRAAHSPRTLVELNDFYGPDVVWAPMPDPREAADA